MCQAGNNRGHLFVPEIGHEVVVGFIGNNHDDPIVTGAVHNGCNSTGGGPDNHIKTIITSSGCMIKFDDTDGSGSITVTDPSGNLVYLDGQGNIEVTASKNFTVKAGENISLQAGMNIIASAGMNITESAGMDISQNAGAAISQNAIADYTLMAANILEIAKGERKAKAKEINEESKSHQSSTEEDMIFNAKKTIQKCFHGGDTGHIQQVQQAINGLINCQLIFLNNCGNKAPVLQPLPVPKTSTDNGFMKKMQELTGLSGAALVIYIIISEGSRLFPPRNLVPVP